MVCHPWSCLDVEGPLVQTLLGRLRVTDWIVPGRAGCKAQASQSRQEGRAFQEISATHGGDLVLDTNGQQQFRR
jgi:hypothetical protein